MPHLLRSKKIESAAIRRVFGGHLNRMHYREPLRDPRALIERIQSWVYVAMDRNATEISRGTLRLYRPDGKSNGFKTRRIDLGNLSSMKGVCHLATEQAVEIQEHPILQLLAAPNPLLECCSLLWLAASYLQLFGETIIYKGRGGRTVKELWPLPNQWVHPILGPENVIDTYEFRYGGAVERFPAADIIHIRKPSPIDMIAALGPLKGILQAAETNLRFAEWQNALFQNHAIPDIMISVDEENITQDQVDAWIADLEAKHGGWRRRGKADVAPFKVKIDRLGLSMKEARSEETLKALQNEILSGFGVPPQVITTDGATFNNLRQGLQLWQRNTIGSYQVVIAQALNRQLLPEWFGESNPVAPPAFLAFDNPVSEDKTVDTDLRIKRIEGGLLALNAGRAEEGNEPVEGGDEVRIPSGSVRLTDPTSAELQQDQIEATTALQQAQIDLQREQAVAAREDAAQVRADETAASEDDSRLNVEPEAEVTFNEVTLAIQRLQALRDIDGVNMLREAMATMLGVKPASPITTLQPLPEQEFEDLDTTAQVDGEASNGQGKPNEGSEETKPGKRPKADSEDSKQDDEDRKKSGEAGDDRGGGSAGRGSGDVPESIVDGGCRRGGMDTGRRRGWDASNPGEYPTRLLKCIVGLETKLELVDVAESPVTLEAVIRQLFEGMEAEVRRNLPDAIPDEQKAAALKRYLKSLESREVSRAQHDSEITAILYGKAKAPSGVELFDTVEWVGKFEDAATPFIRETFQEGAAAGRDDLLAIAGFEDPGSLLLSADRINEQVEKLAESFASQVVDITGRELADVLKEGLSEGENLDQLAARVGELWGIKKDSHAKLIARTEINLAANSGAVATFKEGGIKSYTWLASVDACEFCLALNGKSVTIGESFAPLGSTVKGVEGGTFSVTFRDIKFPGLHPNDRCTIVPDIEVPK